MPTRLVAFLLAAAVVVNGCERSDVRPGRSGGTLLRAAHPVPGSYLVVFGPDAVAEADVDVHARDLAARHGGRVVRSWSHAVRGFVAALSEVDAVALANDPRVAWVEEDGVVRVSAAEAAAPWNLDRVDQRALPLDGAYRYTFAGAGVSAYVIDTGIRASHLDLGGRVARGFSSVVDDRGTDDCNGHGTHVAGLVGGSSYGVAKGVRLVPVRVVDCDGKGSVSAVVSGIDWVTANHVAPAVANISLGTEGSATFDAAVERAIAAGVTFTVAAGNGGVDACTQSPARVGGAITVGAVDRLDAQASFSNWGSCIHLWAPGVGVTSAWATGDLATNTLSGTSMASPMVTGAAALYLSANPSAAPAQVASALAAQATPGLSELAPGSPDRLLYTGFLAAPTATTAPRDPACGARGDRLVNGGFEEQGAGWEASPGAIDDSASPGARTGRWKAWLAGYGSVHQDELSQRVDIPADACAATLSFWLRILTEETGGTNDVLTLRVTDVASGATSTLASFSNLDASADWVEHVHDLGAWRGKTVLLRFFASEDELLATSFLLDDAAVVVARP